MWVDYHLIVTAFGLTGGITVFLTLFAFISKSDFSGFEPYLYQILFIAIIICRIKHGYSILFCNANNLCQHISEHSLTGHYTFCFFTKHTSFKRQLGVRLILRGEVV